jgi:hypothetical protein
MAKTTWGRRETFIWPRHIPIFTYCAAIGVIVLTIVFFCVRLRFSDAPLKRYYLPVFERTSVIGAFSHSHRSV